uniref:Uncharacterized protein n=1 Tax=Utricularia reniformis TaxID=192314 RepID=A0A1Y0B280_9LAMI|nr:hypothetical protein AEK19_MT1287 [Utricularia reniformis]ART31491.1 hypothetical protein AEK19_MT1287 [Utricularia reniformis]
MAFNSSNRTSDSIPADERRVQGLRHRLLSVLLDSLDIR